MHSNQQHSEYVNLADERYGSAVVWTNDDFFASVSNLLKASEAVFLPDEFTDRGKWMDGWESRRRRTPGHDSCIIRLGLPGILREIVVDTAHFRGNFPKACSLEIASVSDKLSAEELLADDSIWQPLIPETALEGNHKNVFKIDSTLRATHLRFHIYPDGGVARLRVYGEVLPEPRILGREGVDQDIELLSVENGGRVVDCNDMFFGSRHNLLNSGRGLHMGDGWETKRSRKEAPDWVIAQLGVEGTVYEAEIDTTHFKGNFPESAGLYGARVEPGVDVTTLADDAWQELLPRTKLESHRRHRYDEELAQIGPLTHVKMLIWPDGGVSRFKLWGSPSADGRRALGLRYWNSLPASSKQALLGRCCHSTRFAELGSQGGPDLSWDNLAERLDGIWFGLQQSDWDQAYAGHPRIGERRDGDRQASREQATVATASAEVLAELARVNTEYEAKFGRIYLVCASGKSAEELLAIAQTRLARSPAEELQTMREEQAKITKLRLQKALFRAVLAEV